MEDIKLGTMNLSNISDYAAENGFEVIIKVDPTDFKIPYCEVYKRQLAEKYLQKATVGEIRNYAKMLGIALSFKRTLNKELFGHIDLKGVDTQYLH
jgi:hypothetical protein